MQLEDDVHSHRQQIMKARLNNMAIHFQQLFLPWPITFSFARAIQQSALSIWHGEPGN